MYFEYMKLCLKNKKGVEGLPLKYVVIVLVAAISIGIVTSMTGILSDGIIFSTGKLNETLYDKVMGVIAGI